VAKQKIDNAEIKPERRFGLGSVVKLRSGGPAMTVCALSTSMDETQYTYVCYWFSPALNVRHYAFREDSLKSSVADTDKES
jgi:uncharacterized protein YodC (DUF2158 family)